MGFLARNVQDIDLCCYESTHVKQTLCCLRRGSCYRRWCWWVRGQAVDTLNIIQWQLHEFWHQPQSLNGGSDGGDGDPYFALMGFMAFTRSCKNSTNQWERWADISEVTLGWWSSLVSSYLRLQTILFKLPGTDSRNIFSAISVSVLRSRPALFKILGCSKQWISQQAVQI